MTAKKFVKEALISYLYGLREGCFAQGAEKEFVELMIAIKTEQEDWLDELRSYYDKNLQELKTDFDDTLWHLADALAVLLDETSETPAAAQFRKLRTDYINFLDSFDYQTGEINRYLEIIEDALINRQDVISDLLIEDLNHYFKKVRGPHYDSTKHIKEKHEDAILDFLKEFIKND